MMSTPPTDQRRRLILVLDTHPFELALAAALLILGVRGLLGAPSPSVAELPEVALYLYLIVSTLGGLGLLIGLLMADPREHLGLGKALERASLFLVASSYAGLAILLVAANGTAGLSTGLVGIVIAGACLLRARSIRKASKVVLGELRRLHREEDGNHG